MSHQAGAYPGFSSMRRLGVFLLLPGKDASPSQGYIPAISSTVPIYTRGWREVRWESSVLPKNATQCRRPGLEPSSLNPASNALTMRPLRLPLVNREYLHLHTFYLQENIISIYWRIILAHAVTFITSA